jgi:hypothetical protein
MAKALESEVVEQEAGGAAQGAPARSSSLAFQGRWCGRLERSRQSAAPRWRHLRMVSVEMP